MRTKAHGFGHWLGPGLALALLLAACAGPAPSGNTNNDNENNNGNTSEICDNGVDDDGDGLTDMDDDECHQTCQDADNDGYQDQACGGTDCRDDDAAIHPGAQEQCTDGADNDCDGETDCSDQDCTSAPECSGRESICDNDVDDDGDGATDCADSDCDGRSCGPNGEVCLAGACSCPGGNTESDCSDGADNDCDGLIDCADPDCASSPGCSGGESVCDNGQDDDSDGLTDCADSDCSGRSCGPNGEVCLAGACSCPGGNTESNCSDGADNDCDGLTDCADPDCASSPGCSGPESVCDNGQDDDSDGLTDCADSDCSGRSCGPNGEVCLAGTCSCPGGNTESDCSDGVDNDCDGLTDMADSADCACQNGDTQTCGVSDVGECQLGTQICTNNQWGPCQGAVYPTNEVCDDKDQDCDGTYNNGTTLPANYDAMEWIPSGWWGIQPGAVVTWTGYLAFYDEAQAQVTGVITLQEAWNALGTAGTQPPTQNIDSMTVAPAGFVGLASDTLFVTAGASYYMVEQASGTWQSGSIASLFPPQIGFTHLDASAFVPAGSMANAQGQQWLVADHNTVWMYTDSTDEWLGPYTVQEAFCPATAQGPCPPCVDSLMVIPGNPGTIVVGCGTTNYMSVFNYDAYSWTTFSMSDVSCAY